MFIWSSGPLNMLSLRMDILKMRVSVQCGDPFQLGVPLVWLAKHWSLKQTIKPRLRLLGSANREAPPKESPQEYLGGLA